MSTVETGQTGSVEKTEVAVARDGSAEQPSSPAWLRGRTDQVSILIYLLGALLVTSHLWSSPHGHQLLNNRPDSTFFEWMLVHGTRIITHGDNPFFTDALNAPYGINLMANTVALGLTLPLVPVTLLFGPTVSLLLLLTFAPFGTAAGWYWLLSRHVVRSRLAAFVGGAFCGFAPSTIAHTTGHPNIAIQVLVPFIVLAALRLGRDGSGPRRVLILAGLVLWQAFINEEILLFVALALGAFLLTYAIQNRTEARRWLSIAWRRIAAVAAVVLVVLAYPLWVQFFGPQAGRGVAPNVNGFGADVLAYPSFPTQSLAGLAAVAHPLSQDVAEQNSFYGWPLLALVAAVTLWLWRSTGQSGASGPARRLVPPLVVTGAVFALLSLGPHLSLRGRKTSIPGPWSVLRKLPLFDSIVPTRLSLVVTVVIAVLLALAVDRARTLGRNAQLPWLLAVGVALVPLLPTPLATHNRPQPPRFFTSGDWRRELAGGTVLQLPGGALGLIDPMQFQLDTGINYRIVEGYFLAPDPNDPRRRNIFGTPHRPTVALVEAVSLNVPVAITDVERAQARADLRFWHATTIVLPANSPRAEQVRAAMEDLLGRGARQLDGVYLWDVRDISG